jgi:hypothetical protein
MVVSAYLRVFMVRKNIPQQGEKKGMPYLFFYSQVKGGK